MENNGNVFFGGGGGGAGGVNEVYSGQSESGELKIIEIGHFH